MRKMIAVFLSLFMAMSMVACSNDGVSKAQYDEVVSERDELLKKVSELEATTSEVTDEAFLNKSDAESEAEAKSQSKPINIFDEEAVLSQLEVKTVNYSNNFWNYAFLTIKNNSDFNLSITANVKFYNETGELIGAKSATENAVESKYETLFYFMPDEKFAKMEYELAVSEEEYYDCVQSDLSYESTKAKNKIILSVTNNGDEAAQFVKAYVLFFNGEKAVGFSSNYITDDDSELKPGKTIDKEMDCYDEFDSFQVYFSGRR